VLPVQTNSTIRAANRSISRGGNAPGSATAYPESVTRTTVGAVTNFSPAFTASPTTSPNRRIAAPAVASPVSATRTGPSPATAGNTRSNSGDRAPERAKPFTLAGSSVGCRQFDHQRRGPTPEHQTPGRWARGQGPPRYRPPERPRISGAAIRTKEFLYVHNFHPERWPACDPETDFGNCDPGPTKEVIKALGGYFFELHLGKRLPDELYDISADPSASTTSPTISPYTQTLERPCAIA